jgi:uncharacterized protein YceK
MNTKKTGAVALSAVALIVAISGCAGVRAQVDAGAGLGSLREQAQTQHQEMAQLRAEQHAAPLDASKLAANEAVRAEKQASTQQKAAASIGQSVNRVQEALRADKQASIQSEKQQASIQSQGLIGAEKIRLDKQQSVSPHISAADQQGVRLTQQAEAYQAETQEDVLKRVADEERRAQHPQAW